MKAVRIHEFGGPEVLRYEDVPDPKPRKDQVLVRVRSPSGATITCDVVARIQQDGVCWVGGTTWSGQPAMRISMSNWSTTSDDIDRSAASILSAAR